MDAAVSFRIADAPTDLTTLAAALRGTLVRPDDADFEEDRQVWNVAGQGMPLAIVRAADTDRLDLVPEAAGLLAASLGLSRRYGDDLEQLDAGMLVYDAFYRWCRDATEETHNWPASKARS